MLEHQLDNHILHCSSNLHEQIRDYIEMQWWDEAKPQIGHTLPELVLEEGVLPKVQPPLQAAVFSLHPGASRRFRVSDGSSLPGLWPRSGHSLESLQQAVPPPGPPHRRPGISNWGGGDSYLTFSENRKQLAVFLIGPNIIVIAIFFWCPVQF